MGKGSAVSDTGRVVIVGASVAGLRAAEALRKEKLLAAALSASSWLWA
ncbi:hypothetical protein [Mycobacterium sp. 1274761.0]|nr:hypothetical protein [Mycobacterium sp. 1274761.0]